MLKTDQLERIVKEVNRQGLDAMLIAPSEDMVCLLDFNPWFCERFQGLFICADGDYFYVCNLLTTDEIMPHLPNGKVYSWFDGDGFIECTRKALSEHNLLGKRIGVNLTVRAFNILEISKRMDIEWVAAQNLCYDSRKEKNEYELDGLRGAAKIADKSFMQMFEDIRPGMTEQEVKNCLFAHIKENGGINYRSIVASGPNGSYPHYSNSNRVLQKGDAVVIDFSCEYHRVRSDMTRTIFVGEPSEFQRKIYDIVLKANEAAEAFVENGVYIPDIDACARNIITEAGYGKYFTTRVGHGIGYLAHETPFINRQTDDYLKPGNAFSIEPGIYLTGDFGVRIEDIVIINLEGEKEILNHVTKDYLIVPCE